MFTKTDYMITENDIRNLVQAANLAGFNIAPHNLQLLVWQAGSETHIPSLLPNGYCAVYIFEYNQAYLKVGKANSKSKARYQSHHYSSSSSNSNLSKSLLNDTYYRAIIGIENTKQWLCNNTTRYNIHIPNQLGSNFVNFVEAYFILKCNPQFEG